MLNHLTSQDEKGGSEGQEQHNTHTTQKHASKYHRFRMQRIHSINRVLLSRGGNSWLNCSTGFDMKAIKSRSL